MDEKFKTWQRKVYIFEGKIRNVEKQRADFRKVVLVQLLFHVPLHHIFYLGICDHRADNSCSAFDIYTIKKYVSKGIVVIFMLKIIMITYRRTLFPLPPPSPPTHTTTFGPSWATPPPPPPHTHILQLLAVLWRYLNTHKELKQ